MSAFAALMGASNKIIKTKKDLEREQAIEKGNQEIEPILQKLGARPASDFTCSIISKGRAKNVPQNLGLFIGTDIVPNFIIGKGDTTDYKKMGATKCIEGGGLCASRNAAIELAGKEGNICLEMSVSFFPDPSSSFFFNESF